MREWGTQAKDLLAFVCWFSPFAVLTSENDNEDDCDVNEEELEVSQVTEDLLEPQTAQKKHSYCARALDCSITDFPSKNVLAIPKHLLISMVIRYV